MNAPLRAVAERVAGLTREEAIEAALALAEDLAGSGAPQDDTSVAAAEFVRAVEEAPYEHLPEVDDLARVLLIAAAGHEEWTALTDEVLEGVGQKAFVFGGTEIIALAALGVVVLKVVLSKGKASEKRRLELGEDGKLVYEEETVYATDSVLGKVLARIIEGSKPQP